MTIEERTQELIDLLSSYGIHSKTIADDIVNSIDKIYEQYNSEVDASEDLPFPGWEEE